MTTHLPGEPFAVIGTLKDVDWTTSTATLYPADGTPQRVDLSRTLSAKKILQAQKRNYRVKGRVVASFIDSSRTTRVEEIVDLELVAHYTSKYKSVISPEQQAKNAENSWHDRWAKVYIHRGSNDFTVWNWLISIWLAIMVCHLAVFVGESGGDPSLVLGAIYVWIIYTVIFGILCGIWFVTGWALGTKFVYMIKPLRDNRIAGATAFLAASLPPLLVAVGILYGLIVHNWHCDVGLC